MINWLQQWYKSQCDGDWEHEYGISINTIDNPGWSVQVEITGTALEGKNIPYCLIEKSDTDWVGYRIENNVFIGAGGANNLSEIIAIFKDIWEANVFTT